MESESRPPPKMESPPDTPKPKPLSRVPRACDACRRQKMRCNLDDSGPPCKRCRHANLECLFGKSQRESTLGSDAGLEQIKRLEERIRGVEDKMVIMLNGLQGLQALLHEVLAAFRHNLPQGTPAHNVPVGTPDAQRIFHLLVNSGKPPGVHSSVHSPGPHPAQPNQPLSSTSSYENQYNSTVVEPNTPYPSAVQVIASAFTQPHPTFHPAFPNLPPISPAGANVMPPPRFPTTLPPIRSHISDYQPNVRAFQPSLSSLLHPGAGRGERNNISNVTSYDSSDDEDDNASELPGAGLVAPLEVLRGLGEEHELMRASNSGNPFRHPDSSSLDADGSRPKKRRKTSTQGQKNKHDFPDVVTKGVVTVEDARELFNIFYKGCSTFLPVFDGQYDTFDSLHERSPFAVNAICMVASQVRDGGGPTSTLTQLCRDEVDRIAAQTLFSPVTSPDAVRAVVILSGWSSNGWLTCGHAVRMALQIDMNKAWPRLLRRIENGKMSSSAPERDLVVAARTWFCLYLFERQMSFGTGRPAILKEDESVLGGSALLTHPLSIEDDARLVSTVELMVFRERAQDSMMPLDRPFTNDRSMKLTEATESFRKWFGTWDAIFGQRYPDTTFYRQSLQIQYLFAELYHEATALRGISGPEDVSKLPETQRQVVGRAIQSAREGLEICLRSSSYREGLKYAVTHTHLTVVFAASFLMRLARLFPDECERSGGTASIFETVEELASLLSAISATRYAKTLRLMLSSRKRLSPPQNTSRASGSITPSGSDTSQQTLISPHQQQGQIFHTNDQEYLIGVTPPPADHQIKPGDSAYSDPMNMQLVPILNKVHEVMSSHTQDGLTPADYHQMIDYLPLPHQPMPTWMSEDNLGDAGYGLESFILPPQHESQIW